jgi:hypothetical protein
VLVNIKRPLFLLVYIAIPAIICPVQEEEESMYKPSVFNKKRRVKVGWLFSIFCVAFTLTLFSSYNSSVAASTLIEQDCSTLNSLTKVSGGTWTSSNGRCVLTSAVTSCQTANCNLMVHNTSVAGDFNLTVQGVAASSSSSWDDFVILFGYQDSSNYYFASFNEANDADTNGIFRVVNGTKTQIADFGAVTSSGSTLHNIEINRTGSTVRVRRDGTLLGTVADSTFINGKVGFGTFNNNASFDNLLVTVPDIVSTPTPTPTPVSPTPSPIPECSIAASGSSWINKNFTAQTGSFTLTFDATPSTSPANMHVGLSNGAQTAYTGFAVIVRFNSSGNIDARNGGAYQAVSSIPYTANTSYTFRFIVNLSTRRYSVYVTPAGGSERVVGENFAFRTEQANVSQLNNYGLYVEGSTGSLQVCNFQIEGTVPPTPTPTVTPTPTPDDPPGKMPRLRVSANGHYFVKSNDGSPFFVAGDTAYFLAKDSTRAVVDKYFNDCKQRGINVIFMSAVHRFDQPNEFGDYPWSNGDASKIITTPGNNPSNAQEYDYWDHVDFILDRAEDNNLYVFMMPLFVTLGGDGYQALNNGRGLVYARFLGNRYRDRTNVAWVLGGDNDPTSSQVTLWREFAREFTNAVNNGNGADYSKTFMSYLPTGEESSSTWFHSDAWLDFNIQQTHRHFHLVYPMVRRDYNKTPPKPTVNGEPLYENHHSVDASQVQQRRQYYQFQLGGGFCVFGNNYVKGFLSAVRQWDDYLETPVRRSFIIMKNLITSKEWWKLIPDQSVITSGAGSPPTINVASRSSDRDFAFIYFSTNTTVTIDMSKVNAGSQINATWIDPRDGDRESAGGPFSSSGTRSFKPPSGWEDAVLLLETVQ